MSWLRLYADAIDDPKLQMLAFEDRWHFIAILCCKKQGLLDGDDQEFAQRLVRVKLGLDQTAFEEMVKRLAAVKLIDRATLEPLAWDKLYEPRRDFGRLSAEVWMRVRAAIFARDDYTCHYCGRRGCALECDHVIPVSRGGSNEETNLVTACRDCNRSKHDKTPEEWLGRA